MRSIVFAKVRAIAHIWVSVPVWKGGRRPSSRTRVRVRKSVYVSARLRAIFNVRVMVRAIVHALGVCARWSEGEAEDACEGEA